MAKFAKAVRVEFDVTPVWWPGDGVRTPVSVMLLCAGHFPDAEIRASKKQLRIVTDLPPSTTYEDLARQVGELTKEIRAVRNC